MLSNSLTYKGFSGENKGEKMELLSCKSPKNKLE